MTQLNFDQYFLVDVQALIFDMDGVVIDSEPIHFLSMRNVLQPLGIELSEPYFAGLVGDHIYKNLSDIEHDFDCTLDSKHIASLIEDEYIRLITSSEISVNPGICELVSCAKKKQLKLGLCTSSPKSHVSIILPKVFKGCNDFNSKNIFDTIVTVDDVEHKKPHPEPYLKVCRQLGVEPVKALVIEDSVSGLQSCKTAGCKCIVLKRFYNQGKNLKEADLVIDDLNRIKCKSW